MPLFSILPGLGTAFFSAFRLVAVRRKGTEGTSEKQGLRIGAIAAGVLLAAWGFYLMGSGSLAANLKVPMLTFFFIFLLCLFTSFIQKTKLGQDFRTVGQDHYIATVSGIDVARVRVLAIILSTVLAGWGQIIFLQNLGIFSTYGAHEQVGLFAVASLLIGGASVSKAGIGNALLGTLLFHTLFIISPLAAQNLFGNAQVGEYFRVFIAYGIIGLALAMYAWKKLSQARREQASRDAEPIEV